MPARISSGSLVTLSISYEPTLYDKWGPNGKPSGVFCFADLALVLQSEIIIQEYDDLEDLSEDLPKSIDCVKVLTTRGCVGWTHTGYVKPL